MVGLGCGPRCCESVLFRSVVGVYVDDLRWVCCDFVDVLVPYGLKFGLVFGVRL